jgi:hypothetical protein
LGYAALKVHQENKILLLQVVLTVSQLIWCREVTEILEGDFDRLEGMKEFEQKNFKVSENY